VLDRRVKRAIWALGGLVVVIWLASGKTLAPLGPAVDRAPAGRLNVSFDAQMRRTITWAGNPSGIVVAGDNVRPPLRLRGRTLGAYKLDPAQSVTRPLVHTELGAGVETVAVGVADGDGAKVVREVRAFVPDAQPDAVVFTSTFRNTGPTAFDIEEVGDEPLLLDRKQAEPGTPGNFVSYQGAAYAWGKDYTVIPLAPGFRQSNFMGEDDVNGKEGVGGGMPLVDVWGRSMGVALAMLEPKPRWVSLPVEVRADGRVELGLFEAPRARLGQKETLAPGETFATVASVVIFHKGDYFSPLATYGDLLRARGVAIPRVAAASAHAPYWKSWGFRKDFTVDKILARLPELAEMGIRTANLDDGWYDFQGDWQPNRAAGKFPGGAADVVAFVDKVHAAKFRTAIWWYPLGVDPQSRLARERRDLLVLGENGVPSKDIDGLHQLCPGHPAARAYIRETARRFVSDWHFDGVYLDFQGLAAVPPCFNPAHNHTTALAGFEAVPEVFADIKAELDQIHPDPFLEACVCALPHAPYAMPFYSLASASDPRSNAQARQRIKAEKAIRGPGFPVGDAYQVPSDEWKGTSLNEAFETAMGTGAVLTTFYADLDARQKALWQRWFRLYQQVGPGDYLNLYDIAFDAPEAHMVRRGGDLYYGFFAQTWTEGQKIELRGLDPGTQYEVYDYGRERPLGTVSGADPHLSVGFTGSLLLRVRPQAVPPAP
jgi:alpha-galactosidase